MKWVVFILSISLTCCIRGDKNETQEGGHKNSIKSISDKEVVCFVYHRFGDNRFPSTNVTITDFENHLKWLSENKFQVLSFSDALHYLQSDEASKKVAVITIDDGYKSFFTNGLPLLENYKMPATLFINTETVGASDYMDWLELQNTVTKGVEIGNHTHSHAYFISKPISSRYKDFEKEIEQSQDIILKNLGITPKVFAYPYGEFDTKMKDIVKSLGFKGAAAQNSGVIDQLTDVYQCPRFPMSESYAKMFEEKALMRSLRVIKCSADNNVLPENENQPLLELTIDSRGLQMNQMQCFIQGSPCKIKLGETNSHMTSVSVQAVNPISNRRRTLYTLTAPDSAGVWHWFSHLWINPEVN